MEEADTIACGDLLTSVRGEGRCYQQESIDKSAQIPINYPMRERIHTQIRHPTTCAV